MVIIVCFRNTRNTISWTLCLIVNVYRKDLLWQDVIWERNRDGEADKPILLREE